MIGIVIVSHSRALANALYDLVQQVASDQVPIAVAAGVGPERQEFGTDAVEIQEAIQSVYSPEGVLVLMDLGSAILSAEIALELLPEEYKENIRFCPAPLIEGAISAAVQAGLGTDLDTVCREAQQSLQPKIEHLTLEEAAEPGAPAAGDTEAAGEAKHTGEVQERVLTLHNLHGLHARPAARFVRTAGSFDAVIEVQNMTTGKGPVSARSLNALATLGAVQGHQILLRAQGVEARQALEVLSQMVAENFGEPTEEPAQPAAAAAPPSAAQAAPPAEGALQAVPVSDGVALGPFFRYQPPLPPIPEDPAGDVKAEWSRLQRAIEVTRQAIQSRRQKLAATLGEAEAAIFDAHLLILEDPDLLAAVRQHIFSENRNAAAAWHAGIEQVADTYRAVPDAYLQQRAADVEDVGNQVLFALSARPGEPPLAQKAVIDLPGPVILFAQDLTPTETSQLDMSQVLGLMTSGGGPTSHSAILARGLGIPAVSGVGASFEGLTPGTLIGLDGFSGSVWIDPEAELQEKLEHQRQSWLDQRQRLLQSSHETATTRDGKRVEVAANVGNVKDAELAARNGAEGIGLLRTEFLYLTRTSPPSEEEQVASLRQIAEALGEKPGGGPAPIIVRTMDVGGDKALPYLPMAEEANPFLGVRALRLSLRNPELFLTQLRAILRAGEGFHFRIMFPMVANLSEVLEARQMLEQAHQSLLAENLPHLWPLETGIMVEIPSAALLSPALAPHVDFFSIGTNDLTQYTLAAERGNPALAHMADALHPAVLRLIGEVCEAAHAQGKWVGVCGELAGDPVAAPILVGLGVDELSMNAGAIPQIKAVLRGFDVEQAQALAEQALSAESTNAARELGKTFYDQLEI